jgi:hypothetical protein
MVVHDLADMLTKQLSSGSGSARVSFGNKSQAFSYVGTRTNALAGVVSSGVASSRNFTAVTVKEKTAPVAWDGPADKPVTAEIAAESVALKTYPGVCSIKTSDVMDTNGLGAALNNALYMQALRSLDRAIVTDLLTTPGGIAKAAALGTIAEAQAQLMAAGFSPDVLVASAALYGTLASAAGVVTAGADPQAPIQSVLGSRLVVSSALTGAQAIALDSSAVYVVEHEASPIGLVDVHAVKNAVDVVIEVVGGFVISNPAGVCVIKA